jgi:hypothetical protein
LGVHGFEQYEVAIYAALVTEDPLLLVGRSGSSAMMTSSVALTRRWPRSP